MILAAMIGYYVFAIGLLVLIGYVTGRQNVRRFKARADEMIAEMREKYGTTAPLEPLAPPAESPEFVPASASAEAETQHIHYAKLGASGDASKLHAKYAVTIAELRALLRQMADAGYRVGPERVAADVFAREAV